jgi:hypothetical protein
MKKFRIGRCPTKKVMADFRTNPLQGSQFRNLRHYIMGRVHSMKLKGNMNSADKKTNKNDVTKKSKMNGKSCITMTGSKLCWKL